MTMPITVDMDTGSAEGGTRCSGGLSTCPGGGGGEFTRSDHHKSNVKLVLKRRIKRSTLTRDYVTKTEKDQTRREAGGRQGGERGTHRSL